MKNILATYKRLLVQTDFRHHRYIFSQFTINNRLTGLIGPRGTGKTTLLIQYIQEKIVDKETCIYVSIDNLYFSNNTLSEFVNELYDDYGVRYFFLDEVQKYPNWNRELKNIYDSFPDIKIIFSGSSSIDLVQGSYDLSRRGVLNQIVGLSFREYLLFNDIADTGVLTLEDILKNRDTVEQELARIPKIKGHFKKYLTNAYYPFFLEDREYYHQKIQRVIEKTIYEDISNYYQLKTENLSNFKKILAFLATIPPGELNINRLAKHIRLDNKTVGHYLNILKETGLIELLSAKASGGKMLRKTQKAYLDNPDLYRSIAQELGTGVHQGTLREIFFIKMIKNSGHHIFYAEKGDFEVEGTIFELGGKNKTRKQIKQHLDQAYLVKDDILYGNKHEIPLYLFGLLY